LLDGADSIADRASSRGTLYKCTRCRNDLWAASSRGTLYKCTRCSNNFKWAGETTLILHRWRRVKGSWSSRDRSFDYV